MRPGVRRLGAAVADRLEERRSTARRLDSLSVAVDENTRLAALLSDQVAELEQVVGRLVAGEKP